MKISHWEPSHSTRMERRTNRHDEANSCFRELCKCASKGSCNETHSINTKVTGLRKYEGNVIYRRGYRKHTHGI